jgi:hypothetical protein
MLRAAATACAAVAPEMVAAFTLRWVHPLLVRHQGLRRRLLLLGGGF